MEVYPEIPKPFETWGCAYACDNPIWDRYGEIALDDQPTVEVFYHQCRGAKAPLYTTDGEVQLSKQDLAEYVRGLYGTNPEA